MTGADNDDIVSWPHALLPYAESRKDMIQHIFWRSLTGDLVEDCARLLEIG
jgi:hypothetical protein